jgi:hypothetical protein
MSFIDKINNLRMRFNSYNEVDSFLNGNRHYTETEQKSYYSYNIIHQKAFIDYVDTNLDKITSDESKVKLLSHLCSQFPYNEAIEEHYTKILKSINLHSKERVQELISEKDEGNYHTFTGHYMPVSIIPLVIKATIYNLANENMREKIGSILINHFSENNINMSALPLAPYEDAVYISQGEYTHVGKEDPEIQASEEFLKFKAQYLTEYKNKTDNKSNNSIKS